jgi:hypothetical protein
MNELNQHPLLPDTDLGWLPFLIANVVYLTAAAIFIWIYTRKKKTKPTNDNGIMDVIHEKYPDL